MDGIESVTEDVLRETLFGLKSVTKSFDLYVVTDKDYDLIIYDIETYERPRYISLDTPNKGLVCDVIVNIYYDSTEYAEYLIRQILEDKKGCVKLDIRGGFIYEADFFEGELSS